MEPDKDHIHVLLQYPPSDSVKRITAILKQESTYYIREQYSDFLKHHYLAEHTLWSDGYFAASVGDAYTATIYNYIENQG